MKTIVHLSDLHFGRVDARIVTPIIQRVRAVNPDLVAVSGDFTQRARRGQFIQARMFLDALPFPKFVVPGNHDVPLYDVAARLLNPFGGYRRYIAEDPVYLKGKYTGSVTVLIADAPYNPGKCQELNFIDYSKQQKR